MTQGESEGQWPGRQAGARPGYDQDHRRATGASAFSANGPSAFSAAGVAAPPRTAPAPWDDRAWGAPPEGPSGRTPQKPTRKRRFSRLTLFLICLLTPLLVIGGILVGGFFFFQHRLDNNISRFKDPFAAIPANQRPAATGNAENILMLGSDSRISAGDPADWVSGAQRTDAIMILHIPANRDAAYVMSIPRDSWVNVPGHGKAKINAAFSWGGTTLAVETIEQLTGIRIDHVVIADFTGFASLTDSLGGVTITVPASSGVPGANVPAGTQNMDGKTALLYVRERHHLPNGDFDREKRQQNWMRAIASKTLSSGTLTNPKKLYSVLSDTTKLVQVDQNFSIGDMRSLAVSMRNVRSQNIKFLTTPVAGTGWSPDHVQSIVNLDLKDDKVLWKAMETDQMDAWASSNYSELLGTNVR